VNSSIFYEIRKDSLSQPSYILGTIHIQDQRVFVWSDSIKNAFYKSSMVAGELSFQEVSQDPTLRSVFLLPQGTTLKSLLNNKKEYKKIKKYAKRQLGWQALMINYLKPIMTVALLQDASLKHDTKYPLDLQIQKDAQRDHKQVVGLETLAEQAAVLNEMPMDEQLVSLKELVNKPAQSNVELEQLVVWYTQGKLLDLYAATSGELDEAANQRMLTLRNQTMVRRLIPYLQNHVVFVAVGAAHLPGKEGILHLLQEQGYRVRPIQHIY
jgi:uncharacterized protein YbaP (TraB family)